MRTFTVSVKETSPNEKKHLQRTFRFGLHDEAGDEFRRVADSMIAALNEIGEPDAYTFVQRFEKAILKVFEENPERPFTQANVISRVNVAQKPGGLGPFMQAWKNVVTGDPLGFEIVGITRKGTPLFKRIAVSKPVTDTDSKRISD